MLFSQFLWLLPSPVCVSLRFNHLFCFPLFARATGCTLIFLYFIVSAFHFVICFASPLLRGPLAVHCFYFTMWQLLILYFMLSLAFVQEYTVFIWPLASALFLHMCCEMPFECTTHIRPPFQVRPLHSAFCTCLNILELGLSYPQNPCKLYLNIICIYNIASVLSAIARLCVFSL